MKRKTEAEGLVCMNRKASFRFEVLEKFECGLMLHGSEVKSLRERGLSLDEAYARIENDEAWLIGCHISAYSHARSHVHEPLRRRKLLLHAREIRKLRPKVEQKGLTLVPLKVYFNERGLAKVTLALARGKTLGDKRHTLRDREARREMDRSVKRRG